MSYIMQNLLQWNNFLLKFKAFQTKNCSNLATKKDKKSFNKKKKEMQ